MRSMYTNTFTVLTMFYRIFSYQRANLDQLVNFSFTEHRGPRTPES